MILALLLFAQSACYNKSLTDWDRLPQAGKQKMIVDCASEYTEGFAHPKGSRDYFTKSKASGEPPPGVRLFYRLRWLFNHTEGVDPSKVTVDQLIRWELDNLQAEL